MHTTFEHAVDPATREPRTPLLDGVAEYYCYRQYLLSQRRAQSPATATAAEALSIPPDSAQFALDTLAFPADPRQQEVLAAPGHRVAVCCCRQWGKSTVGAIKALHHALANPGSLTLLASRTLRQTGGLLEKATDFARALGIQTRRAPLHQHSLLLPNQSRIIALPGSPDSLRGFSAVSLLIVDEAAYVPDELYYALRPMLATTDGPIWLLSTPRIRSGFFYDEWSGDNAIWSKFRVTAADCPRIGQRFLDEERRSLGPALFNREYACDFRYTGQSCFDVEALEEVAAAERYQAAQHFAFGRQPARIYIGFDLGQRESHSAIVVLECVTGASQRRDPLTYSFVQETRLILRRIERLPLGMSYDRIVERLNRVVRDAGDIQRTTLLLDATGCGQPFVDLVRKQRMGVLVHPVAITNGGLGSYSHGTDRVPKKDLIAAANYLLVSPELVAQPGLAGLKELKEEMESYRVRSSRAGRDVYRSAEKDDLIMAFALTAWRCSHHLPKATDLRAAS